MSHVAAEVSTGPSLQPLQELERKFNEVGRLLTPCEFGVSGNAEECRCYKVTPMRSINSVTGSEINQSRRKVLKSD